MNTTRKLILASRSAYRAELLRRLGVPFEQRASNASERVIAGESPKNRAVRLARAKAQAIARDLTDALVIGSDQVAALEDGTLLDKPGTIEAASAQLARSSANEVLFHTALCVIDTSSSAVREAVDETRVRFRALDPATIKRYVARERPLDCAGSFKIEALGISLCERVISEDPTALIGLPLIALSRLLREMGMDVP